MDNQKVIKRWRKATHAVAQVFTEKYFPEERFEIDTFWVSDEVGSVFSVIDMFFNVDRMIEAIELDATFEQLHDYAAAEIEHHEADISDSMPINFKNYVKHGKNVDLEKSAIEGKLIPKIVK